MNWLVTGGTGSFGQEFVKKLLVEQEFVDQVRIFSRDWAKQADFQSALGNPSQLRWIIGDVRDLDRLRRAFHEVDVVVHTAALKDIGSAEYNPREALFTNTIGSQNVIEAAIDCRVRRCVLLSTDKAVEASNLYGRTKALAESLFVQANVYSSYTRFAVVRYGNVLSSRGSVIPKWLAQKANGVIDLTDSSSTRFWVSLSAAADFVMNCTKVMYGGEIFVPKLPSMKVVDLADLVAPEATKRIIGLRPGEKLHEILLSKEESSHSIECLDCFVILPEFKEWAGDIKYQGERVVGPFSSDTNLDWLSPSELRALLEESGQVI